MGDLLPGLIVLAIGGSVAPPLLLLTILFLGSQRPLSNASSLTLDYFNTEEHSPDLGSALPRVRSVLPGERALGGVVAGMRVGALQWRLWRQVRVRRDSKMQDGRETVQMRPKLGYRARRKSKG